MSNPAKRSRSSRRLVNDRRRHEPGHPLVDLRARPIIAHRGASRAAPENTLVAFALALEQGADALEFDVRVTADGVPVVIHDPTLERTTDRRLEVRATTAAEVLSADAGARYSPDEGRSFPWRNRGIRVPTMTEVLDAFPDTPLLIEVKEPVGQECIRGVLEDHGRVDRWVIASASWQALDVFRGGAFALAASRREILTLYARAALRRGPRAVGYRALSVPLHYRGMPVATHRFVRAARRVGCPVHVWTVDDETTARRLWDRGVSGIVTNVPQRMRAARAAWVGAD